MAMLVWILLLPFFILNILYVKECHWNGRRSNRIEYLYTWEEVEEQLPEFLKYESQIHTDERFIMPLYIFEGTMISQYLKDHRN